MTKKSIIFWLGILALIVAIAAVIYTPFYIASLKDVWYKYFAWFLLFMFDFNTHHTFCPNSIFRYA